LGSGFPHPLPKVPPDAPRAPAFEALQPGAARPSYDLAGIAALLGPYWHVPLKEDYQVLIKLRQILPVLNGAIRRLSQLVGFPEIEASPRLKRDIEGFLERVPVNRIQQGARVWHQAHLDNFFLFGRAHAEVVLTADRRDVFGVVEVHPATTGLRPTFGGFGMNVVQYQYGGGVPVTLVPELLLTSVHAMQGDDPNGSSLLKSLTWVGEILQKVYRALGNTYERFGVPTWWMNWLPPKEWNDPQGEQAGQIMSLHRAQLEQAMLNRANGRTSDIITVGDTKLEVMGAQGQELDYSEPSRSLNEQILADIGLPPFMFGFSWSSTERMSTAQAKMTTELIQSIQKSVEPALRQLIDLRQRLVGRTGRFELVWDKVSLQDELDSARSELMRAQADQIRLANWQEEVRSGIHSLEEMAVEFREDLDGVPLEQVREILNGEDGMPLLPDELPEPVPVQVAGMKQPGDDAGNPRDEAVSRALVLNGNGNGK
jgi:hypothetical protein